MSDHNVSGSNNRRWYDEIPNMTQAIHISRDLSTEVQVLIARCLNEAIDVQRKNRRSDKYAVTLGATRALGLHRASYRRRWYDPNPQTYRAFNLMSSVPDAYLEELANRILKAANHVQRQKKSLPWYYDDSVWAGEVRGILEEGELTMRQRDDGIRLTQGRTPRPRFTP